MAALAVYGGSTLRTPTPARVLVTADDCLRIFDSGTCRALTMNALALHAKTAPRFASQELCVISLSAAQCAAVHDHGVDTDQWGPSLVAILIGKAPDDFLPLYANSPLNGSSDDSLPVYFHGKRVGTLSEVSFGGANLPVVNDLIGHPITASAITRLRTSQGD